MIFDRNQNIFPSIKQREVWWWAIGIVPPSVSLTDEVKGKCNEDILEGCYQWYDLFNELCQDMYNNIEYYLPASARQYRDIFENISANGTISGNKIIWDINEWDGYNRKINKSKAYVSSGITLERCLDALERTGLKRSKSNNTVAFGYDKYPKIFHAMKVMESSPDIRKTPARYHFAHCEFRQLFKSYSANYDELLRRASDESHYIVNSIHEYARMIKIQRYIHFGIIKYKYKGIRVLDFNLYEDEYPTLRINIGTCANPERNINDDDFYKSILSREKSVKDIFINNLVKCDNKEHEHQLIDFGDEKIPVCAGSKIRINPFKEDIKSLLCFIEARKNSIEQYFSEFEK